MRPAPKPGANVRNWIVTVDTIENDPLIYGPYTMTAAQRAVRRVERWAKKHEDDFEQIIVGSHPIHQWRKDDEEE